VLLSKILNYMTLEELYKTIENRKKTMPRRSYSASLFRAGCDRIVQKIGEEAIEVIISAKNKSRKRLISETADLLYHVLILLSFKEIKADDVLQELERRRFSTPLGSSIKQKTEKSLSAADRP